MEFAFNVAASLFPEELLFPLLAVSAFRSHLHYPLSLLHKMLFGSVTQGNASLNYVLLSDKNKEYLPLFPTWPCIYDILLLSGAQIRALAHPHPSLTDVSFLTVAF